MSTTPSATVYDRRKFLATGLLVWGAAGWPVQAAEGAAAVSFPEWLKPVAGHCVWTRGPQGAGAWHIGVKNASSAMTALMKSLPEGTKVRAAGQSLRLSGTAFTGELMLHIA